MLWMSGYNLDPFKIIITFVKAILLQVFTILHDLWNARYLKGISGGLVRAQRQLTYDRRGYIAGKRCREVDWGTLIERIGRR